MCPNSKATHYSSYNQHTPFQHHPQPAYKTLFSNNLDVTQIVPQMAAMCGIPIIPNETLLFIDEIQDCKEAIMALRFFKEDLPDLHVIAAGSLLEFVLDDIPTFGVGRIHSMFMFPMTFDEFLLANGENLLLDARNQASSTSPLAVPLHEKLIGLMRRFLLVGGMPEAPSLSMPITTPRRPWRSVITSPILSEGTKTSTS